jgi:hypothetical protein
VPQGARIAGLVAALASGACLQSPAESYGPSPFSCAQAPLCPEGYSCVGGVCRRPGELVDSRLDTPRAVDGPRRDAGRAEARSVDQRPPDHSPAPLFADSFALPGGLVADGDGTWAVEGGLFRQSACPPVFETAAAVPGRSWTNVRVSARVRGDSLCAVGQGASDGGVIARVASIAHDQKRYYYCVINFREAELAAGQVLPYQCNAGSAYRPLPGVQLGVWYDLALTVVGAQVSCSVSGPGVSPASAGYIDSTACCLASGSAGLTTSGVRASFDDFVVALP